MPTSSRNERVINEATVGGLADVGQSERGGSAASEALLHAAQVLRDCKFHGTRPNPLRFPDITQYRTQEG